MQSMQKSLKLVNSMIPVLKLDILVSILYIKSLKLNISVPVLPQIYDKFGFDTLVVKLNISASILCKIIISICVSTYIVYQGSHNAYICTILPYRSVPM